MPAEQANRPEDSTMEITPEIQAAIDAAVESATTGLKAKNDQLLAEKKKLQKAADITPEMLADVEADRDRLQTDLATIQKDHKKLKADFEGAQNALKSESGFTQKMLIENGLSSELMKNGITNPVHLKAAQAMLRDGVQVVIDGENRTAKVGEKSLSDHVKEWAASDEGKHFVAAPGNSGGGATGGNGGGAANVKGKVDGTEAERAAYFAEKYPDLK